MKPFRFWALFFAVLGASALAQSLSNVVTTSTFAFQTTSTETRRSFTGPKFFHRPSKTLDIVETTPKVKYTRTISTPSRITANQKHTRRDVAIDNVAPTSLDELLGTSDTPGMSCSLPSTSLSNSCWYRLYPGLFQERMGIYELRARAQRLCLCQ